ncbi:MAG: ABC transporter ATP-binding protein [Bdellovibrionaceae bacterium]|jgi:ABC-2 type transport system ATP-binding protein|nr:ABC transporter ATP-binding protein [Pseudobdellovibrionaceae bacterium]
MIKVNQLAKNYGPIKAVNNLTFSAKKGDVLGFLGPNGAGKSTTMKILTGFISPSHGDATVCGLSVEDYPIEVKSKIGYMPENAPLYDDMTVLDFLSFIADLREIPKAAITHKIQEVLDLCALNGVKHQTIETLSKGFKRRLSLAQALIHDPEVLILDEPTDGLDPNQKHDVRELIKKLSHNKCIILSTHILEEVESVCNRAIIISNGEKKFDGTPEELKNKSSEHKLDDVFRAITTGESVQGVNL